MSQLPSGTVTFLFTDIEGSTRLWEEHPDAMEAALARHDEILRSVFHDHGGSVFSTAGDAFSAAFSRAHDGVEAALLAQQKLVAEEWGEVTLGVRMALHTGEAVEREGDYFGPALNRTARLVESGHGGQVLVSSTTQEILEGSLPDGAGLIDLGEHRFRDVGRPEHVFQLTHPSLPTDFPPIMTLTATTNNLPVQVTSFVGREQELGELRKLMDKARLVTLTGPGGSGKTRLALEVALEGLPDFADGVWFVDLAPLGDPTLVTGTVASTLGVREQPGGSVEEVLADYLRSRGILLILDNCEHVIEATAELAGYLLGHTTKLRILATSREPLRVGGEQLFPVPTLDLPREDVQEPQEALRSGAVRLFAERASAVYPKFSLNADNVSAVTRVCARLDGIPLALELAAGRIGMLTPEEVAARLDDRFPLLATGIRDAPPRQQTLEATLNWSYGLLEEEERLVFSRLSVFAGTFTLNAAEVICANGGVEPAQVLALLGRLVEKSLVLATHQEDGSVRYRLLDTIREYGARRLTEMGGADSVRDRHAAFYLEEAEQAEPRLRVWDREGIVASRLLEADHNDLRQALVWLEETEQAEPASRLGVALTEFWNLRSYYQEGLQWTERLLELCEGRVADSTLAHLSAAAGTLGAHLRDYEIALPRLERTLELFRRAGDDSKVASILNHLGQAVWRMGDLGQATTLLEESVAIYRELEDMKGVAEGLAALSSIAQIRGDFPQGLELAEEALRLFTKVGDSYGIAWAHLKVGDNLRGLGEAEAAEPHFQQALQIGEEIESSQMIAFGLRGVGTVARLRGDTTTAVRCDQEQLRLWVRVGDRLEIAESMLNLAFDALAAGRPEVAARLAAAKEAIDEVTGLPDTWGGLERIKQRLEETTDLETLRAHWDAGAGLTLDEAVEFALQN